MKSDVMVSVRIPRSLLREMKDLQKDGYFLDISDEIRFIIRKYCADLPYSTQSKIIDSGSSMLEQKIRQKLMGDLNRILDGLKNEQSTIDEKTLKKKR